MQTVVITGGSGSIGQGIARMLLANGYYVILIGRNRSRLEKSRAELIAQTKHNNIDIYTIDITDEADVARGLAEIWHARPFDALVNAAGVGEPVDFFNSTDDDWQASVQSKLLGTTKVIKEAGKLMAIHRRPGKMVVINGTFCYDPHPDFIINSTVNAALAGFTKAASKYLGERGVCLNVINPWITDSASWQNTVEHLAKSHATSADELNSKFRQMNPLKRFTQTEDIGNAVLFLLGERAGYINGASINLDGGVSTGY